MAAESNSKPTGRKMPKLPSEQDLVAFDHSAAGHEGISSNASGSLIIKPCTQAEIDFYISAADHELFRAHMPEFIGVLNLEPDQEKLKSFLQHAGGVAPVQQMLDTAKRPLTPVQSTSTTAFPIASPIEPQINKRASWKPSGGKKLDTGLAIVLENAAAGFKHPNILDVKLGARLWDDDAPQSKRRKLDDVANATTSGSLGFRIAGMKLWRGSEGQQQQAENEANMEVKNDYLCYDKNYGRAFTQETVSDAFVAYLGGVVQQSAKDGRRELKNKHAKDIAQRFLRELESVQFVLENQESRMYSASILMVYEGDPDALEQALRAEQVLLEQHTTTDDEDEDVHAGADDPNSGRRTSPQIDTQVSEQGNAVDHLHDDDEDEDEDEDDEIEPKVHDVRFIDFAHARWTPGLGLDENMLQGVRSVTRILKDLIAAQ